LLPALGIRLVDGRWFSEAVGATPAAMQLRVLGEALGLAVAGVSLGLVGAGASAAVMRSFFFGVGPADPASYASTIVVLLLVSMAATWAQSRRASAVNPAEALRSE
jgi:putative ABC transport system permease protein